MGHRTPHPLPARAHDLPLADIIVLLRRAHRMPQRELATRAGISERALRDLERGITRRPQRDTMHAIARALGVDAATRDLLTRDSAGRRNGRTAAGTRGATGGTGATDVTDAAPGRAGGHDVAALCRLLDDPAARLVTITGPPGVGKSHLARAAVQRAGGRHRRLMFLDDVTPGAALDARIDEWLGADEPRQVLLTAREPVGRSGERRWPVAPLPLPPALGETAPADPVRAQENPAVALLVGIAAAARPGFAVTTRNAAPVVALARHTAGLPLAAQLIGARLRTRQPAELAADLAERLRGVEGTGHLRAVVAWSLAQIAPADRAALHDLITSGGAGRAAAVFTLAAAGLVEFVEQRGRLVPRVPEPVRAVATCPEVALVP
jgi:transcriptional regulator with XRE-family HTH domain